MNLVKNNSWPCEACSGESFTTFSYGNHLRRFSGRYLRAWLFHVGTYLFQSLLRNNPTLFTKHLFSSYYDIGRCEQCGLGRYRRQLSREDLEHYYKSVYWQAGGIDKNRWDDKKIFLDDARAKGQYHFVKDYLKIQDGFRMLDIGAAGAFSTLYLREKAGVRIQHDVVEVGQGWREYYQSQGINHVADFFPFPSDTAYDYIHASGWLEHVGDVRLTIKELHARLKPGGKLFIEVPNCDKDYFTFDGRDVPHIYFFSVDSLQRLFEQQGFKTLKIGEYGWPRDIARKKRLEEGAGALTVNDAAINNEDVKGGIILRALFSKES